MRPLIWFRSDLRIDDNTALSHATHSATSGAIALFIISPGEWQAHDYSPARVDLILRTLAHLSSQLESLGISLLVRTAPDQASVPEIVAAVCREHACDVVFYNREYEVNESRRDAAVTALLRSEHRATSAWNDQVVVPPGELRTGLGRFYTVFTPFKKAWIKHVVAQGGVECSKSPESSLPAACARTKSRGMFADSVAPQQSVRSGQPTRATPWSNCTRSSMREAGTTKRRGICRRRREPAASRRT